MAALPGMSTLRLLGAAGVLALVLASPAAAHKRHHHHHKPKDVKVQLLAFNDFHGNLQTTTTGGIRHRSAAAGHEPPAPRAAPARGRRGDPRQLRARARAQEPQLADS